MSPEIQLTREMVKQVRDELRAEFESRGVVVGVGEFANAVYEVLAERLQLPMKDIGVAVIPDWEDPDVKEFGRQLREFTFEPESITNKEVKEIRVPYRGMPESEYPVLRYATSLPNKGVLHDIAEFARLPRPAYLFAALVEQAEKRDVIFAPGPSHDKIQEALEKNGMMGARFNHAQLGLSEMGEIDDIMLRNYWGNTREEQRQNVTALLGKINPELFAKHEILIGVVAGNLDFIFNPVTGEMEDFVTKSITRVVPLYQTPQA